MDTSGLGGTGVAGRAEARTGGKEGGGARGIKGTGAGGGESARGGDGGVGAGIGGGAVAGGIVETPGVEWTCKATLNASTISEKLGPPSTPLMPGPAGLTGRSGRGEAYGSSYAWRRRTSSFRKGLTDMTELPGRQ